ncbi:MAG: hypothetical protein KBT34_08950 [Prevotella sp.]|nr:hypothetical protein [Candidatus Prevotella equi]
MQEIAGTTSCKGVQIASLNKWAHQENGEHDIFDALPNNVLHGLDDNLYFIDTIIYKSSEETINTYKSQSPRFNADK